MLNSKKFCSIVSYIESQAQDHPNAIALVLDEKKITYEKLNNEVNQWAHYLIAQGVRTNDLVALLFERSIEMVISILAIIKAGGAYLPIDIEFPAQRISFILQDAHIRLLLTNCECLIKELTYQGDVLVFAQKTRELPQFSDQNPQRIFGPDDLIYVIYTSGSTGNPKGCMLTHQAVCNRLLWMQNEFHLSSQDRVLQKTPYSFDVSVWEFFWPLIAGATLVLAKPGGHKDPAYLFNMMVLEKVTICHFVPSMLALFLNDVPRNNSLSLRYVMCSGEALRPSIVHKFYRIIQADLINLYGPTEAAVDVTYWRCQKNTESSVIPIGKPIDNVEIYILDESLRQVKNQDEGELYIAGICLAKGYLNRTDLTNEKFIKNIFSDDPHAKMYKTGDLARYLPDGNIEFLGRIDNQIKLRGFRIELGEIEFFLCKNESIKDAVVRLQQDTFEDEVLVAYIIPNSEKKVDFSCLKRTLQTYLPGYMIPAIFIEMSAFPLTANGKLDTAKFPNAQVQKQTVDRNVCSAEKIESLTAYVKTLLGRTDIQSQDDLFELGATSFTMVRLAQWIHEHYGIHISIDSILNNPSILSIVTYVDGQSVHKNKDVQDGSVASTNLFQEVTQQVQILLSIPTVECKDDLFELGATSFTMVRLAQWINEQYSITIPVEVFLQNPTIESVVNHINQKPLTTLACSQASLSSIDIEAPTSPDVVNFFSTEEREAFFKKKLNIRKPRAQTPISFKDGFESLLPNSDYLKQNIYREFRKDSIPFKDFIQFIGCLRAETFSGQERYLYPSAGKTYAVQTYIHLKRNAVEGLGEGIYYYHPLLHAIDLIADNIQISKEVHFYYNRPIYENAAFTLYFIAEMQAVEPLYGEPSLNFVTIETGSMLQLLLSKQAEFSIGLCPLGTINFDVIRHLFDLNSSHKLIHCVVGGLVKQSSEKEKSLDSYRSLQVDSTSFPSTDIAIIGISGRYPGASTLDEYWENLKTGKVSIREVPNERWDYNEHHNPEHNTHVKWGGFLENVDHFDPLLFHIAPKEAHLLDPQERLLLMQVWETLENAGYTAKSLNQVVKNVGVFVGVMWDDYQDVARDASINVPVFSSVRHSLANRASFVFDFNGPSLVIDTSCSSALTAFHLACQSIKAGDCNAAIVGGVNLILHPNHLRFLSDVNMTAKDGRSCAFSASGTGWVPGEGVGCVLLKPLDKALKDGDHIHGIIKSSMINHSGRTHQFYMPNPDAQAELICTALKRADIDPETIDYIECASSGALLFDSAEIQGLAKALSSSHNHTYRIGSVKPNIGHLESASALSQLTKILLQMKNEAFAPSVYTDPINPLIQPNTKTFKVQKVLEDWKKSSEDKPRRAALSAFGGAGSYGHLILEAYERPFHYIEKGDALIILSASSDEQRLFYIKRLYDFISKSTNPPYLQNMAYTLQVGRVSMGFRVAFLVSSVTELQLQMQAFIAGETHSHLFKGDYESIDIMPLSNIGNDLSAMASYWVNGGYIDWGQLYKGQRIQRIPLPTYPFAEQVYWINKPLQSEGSVFLKISNESDIKETLRDQVIVYLKSVFESVTEVPVSIIREETPLEHYGINSLMINQLHARLKVDWCELPIAVFFQIQTLAALADYFLNHYASQLESFFVTSTPGFARKLVASEQFPLSPASSNKVSELRVDQDFDIAIIGLSGRYPGAENIDEFWENLKQGKDCVIEIPRKRWDFQQYQQEKMLTKGHDYCRWGGFLQNVDTFDPAFFNIVPKEAELMDPQERLFLQTAWEAIEDAGYATETLSSHPLFNKIGVFVGVMWSEYPTFALEKHKDATLPHAAYWSIANRVSYCLNLKGPSLAIDTACSSSLSAIHFACESIRSGSCDLALAGGVNLSLHPNKYLALCQMGFTSSEGKCRSFGEGGDGYVPAEGVGAILLKPLKLALKDGDNIYGIVKGSAVNHGGKTNGYTVPNPAAHKDLVIEAIKNAKINPRHISYIEAHGTGTALGDPIEISGLSEAFSTFTKETQFCAVGSVKSNIGHAEAAAGIAGLTKVLLQLKYKTLVTSLHAEQPNKAIVFEKTPFYIQQSNTPWSAPKTTEGSELNFPRYAGINSFGAGGSNAHIIVQEAPEKKKIENSKSYYLVTLSAKTAYAFIEQQKRLLVWLESHHEMSIESISYTLNVGRNHDPHRGAWVVSDHTMLQTSLRDSLANHPGDASFIGVIDPYASPDDAVIYEEVLARTLEKLQTPDRIANYKNTLRVLANLYVKGYSIDWSLLHQGESKNRISLPTYPFASESYWLPDTPKISDAKEVSDAIVPIEQVNYPRRTAVFLQKNWIASPSKALQRQWRSIVIYDEISSNLAHHMSDCYDNQLLIDIARIDSYLHYDLTGYDALIDLSMHIQDSSLTWVRLLQLFINSTQGISKTVLLVTSGLDCFMNINSCLAGAEKIGLYRMLHSEYGQIISKHMDLDPKETNLHALSSLVFQELGEDIAQNEVCFRRLVRYVPELKEFYPSRIKSIVPFTATQQLLITGGTKGIGMLCAVHFVKKYGVKRVILTGRDIIPKRARWSEIAGFSPSIQEKIKNIKLLESYGAVVNVVSLALDDFDSVKKFIERETKVNGPIAGFIHAAGCVDEKNPAFIKKSIDDIRQVLSPKVLGLQNLIACVEKQNLKFALLFSSVSAMMPILSVGQSDYAMANAYMDYVASSLHDFPIVSIQWPSWKETGMGEVTSKAYKSTGLLSLTDEEGLHFLECILHDLSCSVVMPVMVDSDHFDAKKLITPKIRSEVKTSSSPVIKPQKEHISISLVSAWLQALMEKEFKLPRGGLHETRAFADIGIDSILLAGVLLNINQILGLELNLSIVLEYSTVKSLSEWLYVNFPEQLLAALNSNKNPSLPPSEERDFELSNTSDKDSKSESLSRYCKLNDETIAIIGMSCQFPGANDLEGYWDLLVQGRSAIGPVPKNCWGLENSFYAGLINGIYDFDPEYFLISKEDARVMDPHAMLLLRECLKVIYHAGYRKEDVYGSHTGVYIGARSNHQVNLHHLQSTRNPIMVEGKNYLAANISQFFNFLGPALVVDSACSSALLGLELAINAIQLGKINSALVGGVSLLTGPYAHQLFASRKLLQPNGEFHILDQRASGVVLGEGVGVVYIKPLSLALKDGDVIYATVAGISVNNDGRTAGPATPSINAQKLVMQNALNQSQRNAQDISYIDVNGSGSEVTDLLEIKAIDSVYRDNHTRPCYLGSMKPNIGHPLNAEGIASFIKVCMMLHKQSLVPFLSGQHALTHYSLQEKNFVFPRTAQNMSLSYAALNSFADGGTNAHVILQHYAMSTDYICRESLISPVLNLMDTRYLLTPSEGAITSGIPNAYIS